MLWREKIAKVSQPRKINLTVTRQIHQHQTKADMISSYMLFILKKKEFRVCGTLTIWGPMPHFYTTFASTMLTQLMLVEDGEPTLYQLWFNVSLLLEKQEKWTSTLGIWAKTKYRHILNAFILITNNKWHSPSKFFLSLYLVHCIRVFIYSGIHFVHFELGTATSQGG